MSNPKIVKRTLDLSRKLTADEEAELCALAARPDSEIDFSDIPPLDDDFFRNAVRNPLYRPMKQQLTVRLDADVLVWLKSAGKGYQTKLNAILRQAMTRDLAPTDAAKK